MVKEVEGLVLSYKSSPKRDDYVVVCPKNNCNLYR